MAVDAPSKPTPSTAPSSLFRGGKRKGEAALLAAKRWEAFPSHPQLCIMLRMDSQSCAETFPVDKAFLSSVWPSQLCFLPFLHPQISTLAPGAFGDGSPGFHQFSASAPILSRCILLSVPALEIVSCTESWENSSLQLLASPRCPGLAQVSGHVLRRLGPEEL